MANKGASFEREICKKLSLWFTEGEDLDAFWRTKNSGGRATVRNKRKQNVVLEEYGDLQSDSDNGKVFCQFFCCELKTGYATKTKNIKGQTNINNWSLMDHLDGNKNQKTYQLFEFWKQVTRDAELSKRIPLLFFRRLRKKPCIVLPENFNAFIIEKIKKLINIPHIKVINNQQYCNLIVYNLDAFLNATKGKINEEFLQKNTKQLQKFCL